LRIEDVLDGLGQAAVHDVPNTARSSWAFHS
jgi:hypothetical protein